ncbi:MAG: hypothetical protein DRP90_02550 [Planctomycetota bacterium]|nr:MAG: hypothetical protein DRP90_02550 [Planctomycetota bacterium]
MRNALFLALLLFALAAAGCSGPPRDVPPMPSTSCVYLDSGLEYEVTVTQVVEERKAGLLTSQIMLHNNRSRPVVVYVRARYFNAAGREVRSTFGQWTPLPLDKNASRSFSATAPTAEVVRILFELKRASDTSPGPRDRRR